MTCCLTQSSQEAVAAILASLPDTRVAPVAVGRWTLHGGSGMPAIEAALNGEEWITLTAPLAGGHIHNVAVSRCACDLLKANAALQGSAKCALPPGQNVVVAMREVHLARESLAQEAEGTACAGAAKLQEALDDVAELVRHLRRPNRDNAQAHEPEPARDLGELCELAGWTSHPRSGGAVTVPLDIPGGFAQALLHPGHTVIATVDLPAGAAPLATVAVQAISSFLLQLAGRVRMVRAQASAGEHKLHFALAGQLDRPTPAELNHLLAAMSLAARMSIREVPALASAEIAEAYLRLRGWSS